MELLLALDMLTDVFLVLAKVVFVYLRCLGNWNDFTGFAGVLILAHQKLSAGV